MHCLVTGGAGFIGSHVADELLGRGHTVTALDNLSTGSVANIRHLLSDSGFRFEHDTASNRTLMRTLIERADVVFHLAAAVGVKLVVESPVRTIETNIQATAVVLELASEKKKPVLVASSSEVYGKSTAIPFREDGDMVLGPTTKGRWSYACSKAIDEFLAIAHANESRLPVVVARLFNTVGPRQTGQYGMVIPRLVRQALAGEPITVYGDGTQSRCFAHVHDVVLALIGLMETSAAVGQVFNIGSDQEISILDLAHKVRVMTGSRSEIRLVPYADAYAPGFEDMARRVPDISKIRALLGWTPRRSLAEILSDVIDYSRLEPTA